MTGAVGATESRLDTAAAIVIALIALVGALVTWRIAVAADGAGDAEFAGQHAMTNAEETRARVFVDAYEHYGVFVTFRRHRELAGLLATLPTPGSEDEAARLVIERATSQDLALASQDLFPSRFLTRDGGYNVGREMGEDWAEAAKDRDLDPASKFAEAEKLRGKTNLLTSVGVILGAGFLCCALPGLVGRRLKVVLLGLGTACLVAGGGLTVAIEILVR